jgi:hypothetical protein
MKINAVSLLLKLVPAVFGAVKELAIAARKDSDGGKKVTKEEARQIGEDLMRRLGKVVLPEVERQLLDK